MRHTRRIGHMTARRQRMARRAVLRGVLHGAVIGGIIASALLMINGMAG